MFRKKTAKIGDIVEIATTTGLAYVQYTHDRKDMGELVRVLPGLFSVRPLDFSELARQKELYFIFYTLNYAVRDRQVEIVSQQPVPEWARPYPLMRWAGERDRTGKVLAWKVFNASAKLTLDEHRRTPLIFELTAEQKKLSILQLWPHPVMVRQLARGWTPEREEELCLQGRAEAAARERNQPSADGSPNKLMRHYLYFPKKQNAEKAGERLRNRGFSVEVRKRADGENWLALAMEASPETGEDMEEVREEMEALAVELKGEYDGWDLALESAPTADGEHDQKSIRH